MADRVRIVRVVVASPGDVAAERKVVPAVLAELNQSIAADRGLRLEAVQWETDAFPGFHPEGPQGLIDDLLDIADCDVLVGIFWTRFGTPVQDSQSGTEHEFRLAYQAWQKNRRPQVMVYFNQKPCNPKSKEQTDQWGQVLEFKRTFPKEGLWWEYSGRSQFEKLLRTHLAKFIRTTYPAAATGPPLPRVEPAPPSGHSDYFGVQAKIIAQYARSFVGRADVERAFDRFLSTQPRGYFIVRGGPGQGKTALSCYLVDQRKYVHHFISRTGSRTDERLILRSLLSQLLPPTGAGGDLPESVSELTKTFEELLPEAAARQKKLVIVVDALDELPQESGEPAYLVSEALPEDVYYFITCRPGNRLDRLGERLFSIPYQLYELGPLELAETREMLRARRPDISAADVERAADASQGNPLYLRAVADELDRNPGYSLQALPASVEGFFRNSTSGLRASGGVLAEVLGLLSAARASLSIEELSQITGHPQRQVDEQGIRSIRQFLLEVDGAYSFYHTRFHEFVTRTLLYEDELRLSHRKIADWLARPENRGNEYRWASLAYHLFAAGSREELIRTVNEGFLREKVRRLGYAVLEDVELLSRCLLEMGDPAVLKRCVAIVEGLREAAGGDILPEAAKAVQSYRPGPASFRTRVIVPVVQSIPALEIYVAVLPKAEVAADFFEIIPLETRLVAAIGDAPSLGLKSSFVARFIGNLFRKLVLNSSPLHLGEALGTLNAALRDHEYFERVSMQCVELDPRRGVLRLASAGHPYPVLYSACRGKCDVLPIRGYLLHSPLGPESEAVRYEQYAAEIAPGDIVVLVSDGLTEGQVVRGDPYGYRFTKVLEGHAGEGARAVGEAILDGWRAHPREADYADDVSIIVIAVRDGEKSTRGVRQP